MLGEVMQALKIKEDGTYVDATFGRGGHTRAILDRLGPDGRVLAIDRDPDACTAAHSLFKGEKRLTVVHARFSDLSKIICRQSLRDKILGIVFDLGVSSAQLDRSHRGFSFLRGGPLDMRMDSTSGETAAEWLAHVDENDLYRVLRDFGEERFARRIARKVVQDRRQLPINTTSVLASLVAEAIPTRERNKHPATRSFQAIRIHINQELEELKAVLPQAIEMLTPQGRLAVLSFHSLEDRIVKDFIRYSVKGDQYPPDLPITKDQLHPILRIVGKPLRPTIDEVDINPRCRSAILRIAEKLDLTS
ncbi:MAG: 16S rRNA (cytosine(1402)-N(4))-methyltransferase [Acidiferrobacteraceae bacterium]|nr:16S rRNA (cytosine(1402)-N(4))-methyltransferase [Acidiferrobacteraceae bacterium]